jgi:hypothetical protein
MTTSTLSLSGDETELVHDYRSAEFNDRQILTGLLVVWPKLSSAQRKAIYRIADLFGSRAAWRGAGKAGAR